MANDQVADLLRENRELCNDIRRHIKITTDQQQEIERLRRAIDKAEAALRLVNT